MSARDFGITNHSGILIKRPELARLSAVLQEWINLTQRYLMHFDHRFGSYYYNERASVGVLAAAAWKAGPQWVALEEFVTDKNGGSEGNYRGRCDLFIGDDRDFSVAIEAKQHWPQLAPQDNAVAALQASLNEANRDARGLAETEALYRLGACFAAPSFATEVDEANEKRLAKWLDEVRELEDVHALAWHFPSSARHLQGTDERYYPGTALLLQLC